MSTFQTIGARAIGLATIAADGTVLDTWFPAPELASDVAASGTTLVTAAEASAALNAEVALSACGVRNTTVVAVRTEIKSLADAISLGSEILAGQVRGRVVVNVNA